MPEEVVQPTSSAASPVAAPPAESAPGGESSFKELFGQRLEAAHPSPPSPPDQAAPGAGSTTPQTIDSPPLAPPAAQAAVQAPAPAPISMRQYVLQAFGQDFGDDARAAAAMTQWQQQVFAQQAANQAYWQQQQAAAQPAQSDTASPIPDWVSKRDAAWDAYTYRDEQGLLQYREGTPQAVIDAAADWESQRDGAWKRWLDAPHQQAADYGRYAMADEKYRKEVFEPAVRQVAEAVLQQQAKQWSQQDQIASFVQQHDAVLRQQTPQGVQPTETGKFLHWMVSTGTPWATAQQTVQYLIDMQNYYNQQAPSQQGQSPMAQRPMPTVGQVINQANAAAMDSSGRALPSLDGQGREPLTFRSRFEEALARKGMV